MKPPGILLPAAQGSFSESLLTVAQIAFVFVVISLFSWITLWPLTRRAREELRELLASIRRAQAADPGAENPRLNELLAELQESLDAQAKREAHRINQQIEELASKLGALQEQVVAVRRSLKECEERAVASKEKCENAIAVFPNLKELRLSPEFEKLPDEQPEARKRLIALVSLSAMLAIAIIVNVGMLSQILSELGFIPRHLRIVFIPLYVVLALALSTLEAAVGFLLHLAEDKPVLFWALVLVAGVICTVEGFFYSQVAPEKEAVFELPLQLASLRQQDVFFLWGFCIIVVLIGLGYFWHKFLQEYLSATAKRAVRRQLRVVDRRLEEAGQLAQQIRDDLGRAAASGDQATAKLSGCTEKADELIKRVDELTGRTQALRSGELVAEKARTVDALGLSSELAFWLLSTGAGGVVGTALVAWAVASSTSWFVGVAAGLGLWLLFSGCGAYWGKKWMVRKHGTEPAGGRRGEPIAVALMVAVAVASALVVFLLPVDRERRPWLWLVMLLFTLGAVGLYRVAGFWEFLPVAFAQLRAGVRRLARAVALCLVGVVFGIAVVLQYAAFGLALPMLVLFRRSVALTPWRGSGAT